MNTYASMITSRRCWLPDGTVRIPGILAPGRKFLHEGRLMKVGHATCISLYSVNVVWRGGASALIKYRSVLLILPPILYTTSSPKRGGGVFNFDYAISLDYTPPQKATFMTLPRFMFTVTKVQTITSTVHGHHAWSPYIGEKSCHFNLRAITFTMPTLWPSSRTAILSVMNHGVEEW